MCKFKNLQEDDDVYQSDDFQGYLTSFKSKQVIQNTNYFRYFLSFISSALYSLYIMISISYIQCMLHFNCCFKIVSLPGPTTLYNKCVNGQKRISSSANELISDSQFLKYLEISIQSIEMWQKSHSPDNASFPMSGFLTTIRLISEMFTTPLKTLVVLCFVFVFFPLSSCTLKKC